MQLGDLLDHLTLDAATGVVEVSDVQIDSRQCGPGSLFFAVPGAAGHGATHAADAIGRGAVAVVSDRSLDLAVPVVTVPATQARALLAETSAAIVGHPEFGVDLVGVTGTNGKTTVTSLVAQLARALGWEGANVGTLTHVRTTPAAPELFRALAQIVDAFGDTPARRVVALEVSSHAMDQGRVDGLRFAVVAFTNLSHDHLDYHGTMDRYFASKASLFTPEHAQRAVVWVDDEYGERLAATTTLPLTPVRRADAHAVVSTMLGSTFFWRGQLVTTPLLGGYNVDDALLAMAVMGALGAPDDAVAAAMGQVRGVPGRFELVASDDVVVIVDYAHTPAGLERLLGDVRDLAGVGRVITVVGCGGERDREKRPVMGAVASSRSDVTIVTSDNPRGEDPDVIIDAVVAGAVPGAVVRREVDRRAAIRAALAEAERGDVVVVAGKGHETTQTFKDRVVDFDDREVVRELLR